MENIGQVTVDLSGNLAIASELCARLGFAPVAKLTVARGQHGEATLKPMEHSPDLGSAAGEGGMEVVNQDGVLVFVAAGAPLAKEQVRIIEKDGLLVITGMPPGSLENIVEREREARLDELLKGSGF